MDWWMKFRFHCNTYSDLNSRVQYWVC
jgi:hypothetical protein